MKKNVTDYGAIYAFLHSFSDFHEFLKKYKLTSKKLINDFTKPVKLMNKKQEEQKREQ